MSQSILIVEDEETLRESLRRILQKDGYAVDAVGSAEDGMALVEDNLYDIIISDIILPKMDGIEFLVSVKKHMPEQTFVVITAYASLDTAVKALRAGAYDYITKPIIHEEIKQVVRNALRQSKFKTENAILRRQILRNYDFGNIMGESPKIKDVIEEVRKISDTRSGVLLLGETGTGKELFSRAIHHNSSRADMPFVPINCSAIPDNLLENELFGHVRGAFTGAVSLKKGLLEEADGGTVFLDEIGELPISIQVKLLRVIEDFEIRPLGSTKTRKVDLRFIAATNKDLQAAMADGSFREDLFYRINVITVRLPSLRERREDIPLLAGHFYRKYAAEMGKPVKEFSQDALSMMAEYRWPGNVRELQNVVERLVLIAEGPRITPEHLPVNIAKSGAPQGEVRLPANVSIDEYAKSVIIEHQGTKTEGEIAEMLGITRKTLWEKRKRWGMKRAGQ